MRARRFRVATAQIISETLEGEAVVIDLDTGTYYSLDPVGTTVWDAVTGGATVEETVGRVQPKLKAQRPFDLFADGRSMRPPVAGTVAQGERSPASSEASGKDEAGEWLAAMPVDVTIPLLQRGQERYDVFCSPCHGLAGYGDGIVGKRAERLAEGTWTPPTSVHTEMVRSRPAGQLLNTITSGIRNMPAYGSQIPVADRWAIVAYVHALQRSQDARLADVPAELRSTLR